MSLLLKALDTQLVNCTQFPLIITRPKMNTSELPTGATLTRRRISGSRVIVKNRREYSNVRDYIARWPEAGLEEWGHHRLIYVLSGRIDYQLGRYGVQCGGGFCLIIPAGTPQPDGKILPYHAKGGFCELLQVIAFPRAVQAFMVRAEDGKVEHKENYLFENGSLAILFHLLMEELVGDRKNSASIGQGLLSALWLAMHREVEEGCWITPGPSGRPREAIGSGEEFETQLVRYLQTQLMNPSLDLQTAARALYLSRTQFVRKMRRETGKTFIQFLTDYRVSEAKALLQDSNWTITAIAGFLGFKSPTYFQAVFRKATGQTPGQYRESSRKKG